MLIGYLEIKQKKYFNKIYNIGYTNTAMLFIKKSLYILNDIGKLSFVMPKSLYFASNWYNIREMILDNLEMIIDCKTLWKK